MCLMQDVSLNMGIFGDDKLTDGSIKRYVESMHMTMPYLSFPKGFLKSTCRPVPSLWQKRFLPGWNSDLTVSALETVPTPSDYKCSEKVEHRVLLHQRDTFANFFHDSEDFVNVFLAMAVLKWRRGDTQIVLTDLFPHGPFWY